MHVVDADLAGFVRGTGYPALSCGVAMQFLSFNTIGNTHSYFGYE